MCKGVADFISSLQFVASVLYLQDLVSISTKDQKTYQSFALTRFFIDEVTKQSW